MQFGAAQHHGVAARQLQRAVLLVLAVVPMPLPCLCEPDDRAAQRGRQRQYQPAARRAVHDATRRLRPRGDKQHVPARVHRSEHRKPEWRLRTHRAVRLDADPLEPRGYFGPARPLRREQPERAGQRRRGPRAGARGRRCRRGFKCGRGHPHRHLWRRGRHRERRLHHRDRCVHRAAVHLRPASRPVGGWLGLCGHGCSHG